MKRIKMIITAVLFSILLLGCEKEEQNEAENSANETEQQENQEEEKEYRYYIEVKFEWTDVTAMNKTMVETGEFKTVVETKDRQHLEESLYNQKDLSIHNSQLANHWNGSERLIDDGNDHSYFPDRVGEGYDYNGQTGGRYLTYFGWEGEVKKEVIE